MDIYPRDPAFWEPIDGDINALAVVQPSGRAINSDVLMLDGDVPVTESVLSEHSKAFASRNDIVLADADTLRRWVKQNGTNISSESRDFISSIGNLSRVYRDEACSSLRWAGDRNLDEQADMFGKLRLPRAVGALLWGGAELVRAATPPRAYSVFAEEDDERTQSFATFGTSRVEDLLYKSWRLDSAVSHREMVFMVVSTPNLLDHSRLRVAELIYATAHCRRMVLRIKKPDDRYRDTWLSLRAETIESFRALASDDSALMWFAYLDQSIKDRPDDRVARGYNRTNALTVKVRRRVESMHKMAARLSFVDAQPFMDSDIWDVGVIKVSLENGIDMDMARELAGSEAA